MAYKLSEASVPFRETEAIIRNVDEYHKNELEQECIEWLQENRHIFKEYERELFLESLRIDHFNRMYGFLIDEACPGYLERENLQEGLFQDVFVGVASMIPGIGSMVAAGGTFYYLDLAQLKYHQGDKFMSGLNGMAAIFTAQQFVPWIGTAMGWIGKGFKGVLKAIFTPWKFFKPNPKMMEKVIEETTKLAVKNESTIVKAAGPLSRAAESVLEYGIKAKDLLKKVPGMSKLVGVLDDLMKHIKTFMTAVGKWAGIVKSSGGAATLESKAVMTEVAEAGGLITKAEMEAAKRSLATAKSQAAGIAKTGERVTIGASNPYNVGRNIMKTTMGGKLIGAAGARFNKLVQAVPGLRNDLIKSISTTHTFAGQNLGMRSVGGIMVQGNQLVIRGFDASVKGSNLLKFHKFDLTNPAVYEQWSSSIANSPAFKQHLANLAKTIDDFAAQQAGKAGATVTKTGKEVVEQVMTNPKTGKTILKYFFNPNIELKRWQIVLSNLVRLSTTAEEATS